MGKMDLKNAFHLMPVRWHLLAIHWEGQWYLDKCLPFGLRSSPALFNELAEALVWILRHRYAVPHIIHYLDDFFTARPPHSTACQQNMTFMSDLCARVNAPLKHEKTDGPATTLTFLGIELDSVAMTGSISQTRKDELLQSLHDLVRRHTCTKRSLLSLIGKLAFACKVVPPGRTFLRRLIDLSTTVSRLHHHITLSKEAKADRHWWLQFLPTWPGTSLLLQSHWTLAPHMQLATDASDLGYGGFWAGRWFSQPWPPGLRLNPIAWREMYAVLVACTTWGHAWQRKRLRQLHGRCGLAEGVNPMPSPHDPRQSPLLHSRRSLFPLAITHIPGTRNQLADHLSRLSLQAFRAAALKRALHNSPPTTRECSGPHSAQPSMAFFGPASSALHLPAHTAPPRVSAVQTSHSPLLPLGSS